MGMVSVAESAFEGEVVIVILDVLTPEKLTVQERPTFSPEPPSPPSMVGMVWFELPDVNVAPEGRLMLTLTSLAVVSPQFCMFIWIECEPEGFEKDEGVMEVTMEGGSFMSNGSDVPESE